MLFIYKSLVCLNYPRFDDELAPDDVYTAIRVHSLLQSLYPKTTIEVTCHTDRMPIQFLPRSLTVSLGGGATNPFSRALLLTQPHCYDDSDGHIVIWDGEKYDYDGPLDTRIQPTVDKLRSINADPNRRNQFISTHAVELRSICRESKQVRTSKDAKNICDRIGNLMDAPLAQNGNAPLTDSPSLDEVLSKLEELGKVINKDYAFVSRLSGENGVCNVVLSGCRAYGQLAFYTLLRDASFYEKILKHDGKELVSGNVQAILPIAVSPTYDLSWEREGTRVEIGRNPSW